MGENLLLSLSYTKVEGRKQLDILVYKTMRPSFENYFIVNVVFSKNLIFDLTFLNWIAYMVSGLVESLIPNLGRSAVRLVLKEGSFRPMSCPAIAKSTPARPTRRTLLEPS